MDWIAPAQDKDWWRVLVNVVIIFRIPSNAGRFLSRRGFVRFSGGTVLHASS